MDLSGYLLSIDYEVDSGNLPLMPNTKRFRLLGQFYCLYIRFYVFGYCGFRRWLWEPQPPSKASATYTLKGSMHFY
ncbi:hypothetical protein AQAU111925_13545 [Aquirufa aurantiipilula]